ncbi:nicotinate-nucleotide--dimethylbenzimidazole phosphoribosyltransferase [Reichenbachiella versicolor]|uniref:nicotinate-nucleotide--dimethylbenzimidazole phosphoribosyltransferase n=1 Tax=Reichenbachiella versicolor TaxID=1821036 RepID=UPI000D6E0B42|nr:nicotinate-nucleotide--dimethylbenzimidazole phosphoribosyltransferase [Reichenbachiella versicolor]
MSKFRIKPLDHSFEVDLQSIIDTKTKPLGALGQLEELALQIGLIQNTEEPHIDSPSIVVFAGDHGIAKEQILNPYPQEVTAQMVYNFLNGGAAINVFCKQQNIDLKIVDCGVNHDFEPGLEMSYLKVAKGTNNYKHGPAMTPDQCEQAIENGASVIEDLYNKGCNTVGFGEMGISNTSSAALIMRQLTRIRMQNCVGAGTGLTPDGVENKIKTLKEIRSFYNVGRDPFKTLYTFGGFEIASMVGGMLKAAELGMIVLVDGFISSAALLVASKMNALVREYSIFTHESDEHGHQLLLKHLDAFPILNLGMRLGEGTGCAMAMSVIHNAVAFLNNMASFEEASVSQA